MFNWFTKARLRGIVRIVMSLLMIISLFGNLIPLAIFAVLMLILMELEDIKKRLDES